MTGFVINIKKNVSKVVFVPEFFFSEWISKHYLLLKYHKISNYSKQNIENFSNLYYFMSNIYSRPRIVANKPFILRYSNVFISNMHKGPNLTRKIYSDTNESLDNEFDLLLWMSCGGIDWLIVYISYGFSVYHT